MNKNLLVKTGVVVAVLLIFLFGIFGIPKGLSGSALKDAIAQRINLGLDLKGGSHLILQVQVNDAVNAESDRAVERLKQELKSANVTYTDISKPDPQAAPDRVVLKGIPTEGASELRTIVNERLPEWDLTSGVQNTWFLSMKPQSLQSLKQQAVTQAIETIRNRIDALGVSEPVIQEHGLGEYQILVQLPGLDDPDRAKEIMQSTAMLEIRQSFGGPFSSEQEARTAMAERTDVVPMRGRSIGARSGANDTGEQWYLVSRTAAVSGRDLRSAEQGRDQTGRSNVVFHLTGDGGRRFYAFTSQHVGESLAVVLDGKVQEVANIKEAIRDDGTIEGSFTDQQARDLAMVLRSGALPAGIKYLEERTVGPSLGADSIREGVRAAVIGMVAVMLFMFVYYRGAGINANVGLTLNLIILLGFLGFFGGVLTLPGIAGVILTVGMGVDSNVLIFERIREELRAGKSSAQAVDQGFAHAWITIIDTHVTTIVSAAILFIFGTGPVKGFATTLTFGLLANLFTAVFVSRLIFDSILQRKQRGEALSI